MESKPVYYTNSVDVGMSQFDLVLKVSYRDENVINDQCQIVMSPQHYKRLVEVMTQTLLQYEELFGPISNQLNESVLKQLQQSGQVYIEELKHEQKK